MGSNGAHWCHHEVCNAPPANSLGNAGPGTDCGKPFDPLSVNQRNIANSSQLAAMLRQMADPLPETAPNQKEALAQRLYSFIRANVVYLNSRFPSLDDDSLYDVCHDAVIRIIGRPEAIAFNEEELRRYFFMVSRNLAFDRLRSATRTRAALALYDSPLKPAEIPGEELVRSEVMHQFIESFSTTDRELLLLLLEELTPEEVAEKLGEPPSSVRQRLSRLRRKFREFSVPSRKNRGAHGDK
jgi:RNA polymerase sigma factor (sigma-70 family)